MSSSCLKHSGERLVELSYYLRGAPVYRFIGESKRQMNTQSPDIIDCNPSKYGKKEERKYWFQGEGGAMHARHQLVIQILDCRLWRRYHWSPENT